MISPLSIRPRVQMALLEAMSAQLLSLALIAVAVANAPSWGPVVPAAQLLVASLLSGYSVLRASSIHASAQKLDAIGRGKREIEMLRVERAAEQVVAQEMPELFLAEMASGLAPEMAYVTGARPERAPASPAQGPSQNAPSPGLGSGLEERSALDVMRDELITAFAGYGHQISVSGAVRGPSFVRFQLTLPRGVKPADLRPCLEGVQVAMELPQRLTVVVERGKLVLDVPLSEGDRQFFDLDILPAHKGVPIGIDIEGALHTLEFGDAVPSLLMAGCPGSGKTSLMACWLESLLRQGELCCIADGKGSSDWMRYAGDSRLMEFEPGGDEDDDEGPVFRVANSQELALAMIEALSELRKKRAKAGVRSPKIHFFADELPELFAGDIGQEIKSHFSALCRLGREHGIHVIGGLQHPTATAVDTQIRGSMAGRLCLQCVEASAAQVMGSPGLPLSDLSGRGDCYWIPPGGAAIRLQTPYCGSPQHSSGEDDEEDDGADTGKDAEKEPMEPATSSPDNAARRKEIVAFFLESYRIGNTGSLTLRQIAEAILAQFLTEHLLAEPETFKQKTELIAHLEDLLGKQLKR